MVYIYYLSKNNVPFYIGKTKCPTRRKHKHYSLYGKDIELNLIDECENEKQIWKFWENYWIDQFKAWGFNLTNQNKGGGGPSKYSEELKQKMRKPRKNGTGEKISKTLKENNHSKYYTDEVKEKIRKKLKGISKPFSQNHIKNLETSHLKRAKIVLQYDLNGKFIKEWKSKGQASKWIKEQTGKTSNITSQIKDCIIGRQKTAYGFIWKYKD